MNRVSNFFIFSDETLIYLRGKGNDIINIFVRYNIFKGICVLHYNMIACEIRQRRRELEKIYYIIIE